MGGAALHFYPRPPRGGRPADHFHLETIILFLSTPSARRATTLQSDGDRLPAISIHALREEGDIEQPIWNIATHPYFYPRPPRGGRLLSLRQKKASGKFLSTPSARRATCCVGGSLYADVYFYPRPPRGGRRDVVYMMDALQAISIHALREEGDGSCRGKARG